MRVVVQRTTKAKCLVDNQITGQIEKGFLLLVGFTQKAGVQEVEFMARKILGLRIFEDENGKLNRNLQDVGGSVLCISQFTLYADCKKGNRPSFTKALAYEDARVLYDCFCETLLKTIPVERGIFGADMKIDFINDGPVTIVLDSQCL